MLAQRSHNAGITFFCMLVLAAYSHFRRSFRHFHICFTGICLPTIVAPLPIFAEISVRREGVPSEVVVIQIQQVLILCQTKILWSENESLERLPLLALSPFLALICGTDSDGSWSACHCWEYFDCLLTKGKNEGPPVMTSKAKSENASCPHSELAL